MRIFRKKVHYIMCTPGIIVAFDFVTYFVWIGSYVWLLADDNPALAPYRNMHTKYVSHFFATITLLYMARKTRKHNDKFIVTVVFCFALLFDLFNVVYTLRFLTRSANYVAWGFGLGISITFSCLSFIMLMWWSLIAKSLKTTNGQVAGKSDSVGYTNSHVSRGIVRFNGHHG